MTTHIHVRRHSYLSEDEGVEDSDAEDDALGGKGKEKVKVKVSDGMDLEGAELAKEKERRRRWKEKQNEEGGKGGKVAKLRTVAVGPVFCMRSAGTVLLPTQPQSHFCSTRSLRCNAPLTSQHARTHARTRQTCRCNTRDCLPTLRSACWPI